VIPGEWARIRAVVSAAFRSSLHCSVATVGADGAPHVTPIGSVLLTEPGRAIFFEIFTRGLPRNLAKDARVSILAVDSGLGAWFSALVRGRFSRPPGVRLTGRVVGERRPPTAEELRRWRRKVRFFRWTPGYRALWGKLDGVRDVAIEGHQWIHLGRLTSTSRR
jgi:hypothetical protein